MNTRAANADVTIHGAVVRLAVPCFRSSPMLGVGGGSPQPRKSSAVIAVIALTTVNGTKVTMVAMVLGRMCRNITRAVPAPRTSAAAV